jgi:hypothetical protein
LRVAFAVFLVDAGCGVVIAQEGAEMRFRVNFDHTELFGRTLDGITLESPDRVVPGVANP